MVQAGWFQKYFYTLVHAILARLFLVRISDLRCERLCQRNSCRRAISSVQRSQTLYLSKATSQAVCTRSISEGRYISSYFQAFNRHRGCFQTNQKPRSFHASFSRAIVLIRLQVTTHHEDLLSQAANAKQLSGSLTSVKSDLTDLDTSVEKCVYAFSFLKLGSYACRLRRKISDPYHSLHTSLAQLQKFQQASDVLRRTSRFVVLARRLEGQMMEIDGLSATDASLKNNTTKLSDLTAQPKISISTSSSGILGETGDEKERTIAKAALSIAELGKSFRFQVLQ